MKAFIALFPGQGSQMTGMGLSFYDNFAYIKLLFEEASDALAYDCRKIIRDNPDDCLQQTRYTQPLLLLASIAAYQVVEKEYGIKPLAAAGHSLGEYTALCAANSLSIADAVTLVSKRGELMQNAVKHNEGAMAAIIGCEASALESLCHDSQSGYVACANYNAPGQIVVSGEREAVLALMTSAKTIGARLTKILAVSVPSHCELMKAAAEAFSVHLSKITLEPLAFPIIDNVDACEYSDSEKIKQQLTKQLYSPVYWSKSIGSLFERSDMFIEFGPGQVLSNLNKRIAKSIQTVSIDSVGSLEKLRGL